MPHRPVPPKPLWAGLLAALLATGLVVSGCGGSDGSGAADPGASTKACRAKWSALGATYAGRGDAQLPSQLPNRWTAFLAGVDYYRTSATARDCGSALSTQRSAAEALTGLEPRLRTYDMTYQLQLLAGPVQAAVAQEGADPGRAKAVARAKRLTAALTALTTNAPGSYQEQSAGWDQLDDVELTAAATTAAINDLSVISSEGYRYQICQTSLATIARITGGLALGSTPSPTATPSATPSSPSSPSSPASPSPSSTP